MSNASHTASIRPGHSPFSALAMLSIAGVLGGAALSGCKSPAAPASPPPPPPTVLHNSIVFYSTRNPAGVYAMHADGSGQVLLSTHVGAGTGVHVSPDGRRIAFTDTATIAGSGPPPTLALNVAVMNVDGTGLTQLTKTAPAPNATANWGGTDPVWSPDGKQIVFAAARDGYQQSLFIMNADGSGQGRLTANPSTDSTAPDADAEPAWSPDGQTIVFLRSVTTQAAGVVFTTMTVHPDGSGLAPFPAQAYSIGGPQFSPSWSPDSRRLAFGGVVNGQSGLVTINADGSGATILVPGVGSFSGFHASWSPDGTTIAYADYNGTQQIYLIPANGKGAPIPLTSAGSTFPMPDNTDPAFSPLP
jgi:TolB protein